ncbi:MAG: HU family DNA-binding protein [Gammaproteobacteria bacterium]|nr:MAG: HU family DNA-binding protein [Gammaproteobacteria bacterium]UTW41379.1 HU family DNA-binding protein [bacterium SCSIO 12844]
MNKTELIEFMVKNKCVETKAEADRVIKSFQCAVECALKKNKEISLTGFGSFKISKRPARTGRNPKTGEPMKIKASKVVRFNVGKKLKDAVNK